jgi:phospholipase C
MTPAELRARIDTIVILMMENRSFDHMLGHLSLPQFGNRADVAGLDDLANPDYVNRRGNGQAVHPFAAKDDGPLISDLPHERSFIAEQLAFAPAAGGFVMNGFVTAWERYQATTGVLDPPPMRILTPQQLPVTGFLADQYLVCNNWHAPLPASTQPNRLMALSGDSLRDRTEGGLIGKQDLVFDWLDRHEIRWRVYSSGLSFFFLMPHLWDDMLDPDRFRSIARLAHDFQNEADFPQVIFVEPDFDDSPIHLSGHANDNHPPMPVSFGEVFLKTVHDSLAAKPSKRWDKTLMVLTYDEHGGFFDHVSPPAVPYAPPPGAQFTEGFTSLGVRVPAILVSPYAPARPAANALLDHTSILQMLADRFDPDGVYSASVEKRRKSGPGLASVTDVLSATPRADRPRMPDLLIPVQAELADVRRSLTPSQTAFAQGIDGFATAHGAKALDRYPQIAHWLATRKP